MWHVWTAVLCLLIAVCDARAQGSAAAPESTTPQAAAPQIPPPPQNPSDQQTPPASPRPRAPQADETPEIKLPTGPMRVERWAVSESRSRYDSDPPPKPPSSRRIVNERRSSP